MIEDCLRSKNIRTVIEQKCIIFKILIYDCKSDGTQIKPNVKLFYISITTGIGTKLNVRMF